MSKSMRKEMKNLAHEGHQGIVRTKQRLREKVWWLGMDAEAEQLVTTCNQCQLMTNTVMQTGTYKTDDFA